MKKIEKLVFEMDHDNFCATSWDEVVREIEKDLLTHGGDVIIHGYDTDPKRNITYIEYSLLFHSDQSQKQPEKTDEQVVHEQSEDCSWQKGSKPGKQPEKCEHDFDLNNRCTRCGVRGVRDMTLEPEKQGEWREVLKYATLNDALLSNKTHRWLDDVIWDYEKYGMGSNDDSDKVLERLKDLREFLFNYYSAGNGDAIVKEELKQLLSERTEEILNEVKDMKYKGDILKYKHIKTIYDCKTADEYIWFVRGMALNDVIEKLSNLKEKGK